MKFYEIDNGLQEAIISANKPVRLKIEIELPWGFEGVFEQDVLEADFFGLKEAAGGLLRGGKFCSIIRMGFIRIPARGRGLW